MVKKVQKKIIHECAMTFSPYDFEGTLLDAHEHIAKLLKEYGPDARLDFDPLGSDPYSDNPGYSVMIQREETDEEMEKRLVVEQSAKLVQEARDRAELKRLQDKLGVK